VTQIRRSRPRWRVFELHQFGQPEIEHLHRAVFSDDDVGGLDVAMDNAAGVSGRECIRDGNRDAQELVQWQAMSGNPCLQARPPHVLHNDEIDISGRFNLEDGDDVRVIESGGRPRLLHEPPASVLVREALGGKYLDRNLAPQARIARAIHFAHASGPDGV
jgi:hypothetical protein